MMELWMDEEQAFPRKFLDVNMYVRIGQDGMPQLVRVEPMFSDSGQLLPHVVSVFVDNDTALVMDRCAVDVMTAALSPVGKMTHWKQNVEN